MRTRQHFRALAIVLCAALLLLLALGSGGANELWATLVPFVFFAVVPVLAMSLPQEPRVRSQLESFLSLDNSRAPPTF